MKNKLLMLILVIFLLNLSIINAANNAVAYHESVPDVEKTVKVLFHSWGEGLTTTIDLDEYFPIRRDSNLQYLYIAPPEIIVSIDQVTGIATLKESKDWIGTKEIFFSLVNIYDLYEGQTILQKYVEKIKKERESETVKTNIKEFEDSSLYPYLNSLLDKLEKEKGSSSIPEIKSTFEKPNLKIDVGDTINFNIGVETKTKEGIKTYRPYLILNIKPEKITPQLEEGAGYSIWVLAPLFIILIVLAVMLYFYLKDNLPAVKRFINKLIPTKKKTTVDVITQDIKNLKLFSLEFKKLSNQLSKLPEEELSEQYFNITKKIFNNLTHPNYEFTYAEITKEFLKEDLNDELKNKLVDFSKELSDLRFSEERVTKSEIKDLIGKTQSFIEKAIQNKQKIRIKESIKLIEKSPWIKYLNFIKSFFKKEEGKLKKLEVKEKLELIKLKEKRKERVSLVKNILHKIGLYKTLEEKKKEQKEKERLELEKRKLKLEKKKEHEKEIKGIRKLVKKVLHDKFKLFKTKEEKLREIQKRRKEEEEKRIKKIEIKNKLRENISNKISSFFKFIIKKRKLTPAEELQILMKLERQALTSGNTRRAHEIDEKINKLYKEIQKKPSVISKEVHLAYQKLKDEFKSVQQRISESKPKLEIHKPKITFLDKFKKIFSPEIEKTKIDEIKFLIKKIEDQFELKTPENQKISEYFLRASSIYQKLNRPSKSIIAIDLLKIKNKIGVIAIKSAIEKAETALKDNQLKKAEEIYTKLNKTYYELPLKEREKLHEKRVLLQQKIKPITPLIHPQKEEKPKRKLFELFKPKFTKLFKPNIQYDIEKIKERVTKIPEAKVEKLPTKKEFEVKESFKDYLIAKKPSFPSIQTFLTKKETENKQVTQILKIITNVYNYLSKEQHEKAKNTYLEAIKLFKELPEDVKPEIRDNIYHKLIPLKKQILDLSLHNSLKKAKEAVMTGKIKDAKQHHETVSKIYTHLATNTDIFIPGPITLKEKELDNLIERANNLIKSNKTKEAKEFYTKINDLYNELPPFKKQSYYNKISVIYNELLKK